MQWPRVRLDFRRNGQTSSFAKLRLLFVLYAIRAINAQPERMSTAETLAYLFGEMVRGNASVDAQIRSMEQTPSFAPSLLVQLCVTVCTDAVQAIISHSGLNPAVRYTAALTLKRFVEKLWRPSAQYVLECYTLC